MMGRENNKHWGRFLFSALLLVLLLVSSGWATSSRNENIPLSVRRVVVQAQNLLAKNQYDAALRVLQPQLNLPQHHYLIDFTTANIYLMSQRKPQAIPYYKKVLQHQPDHLGSVLNIAHCYYATERYLAAAKAFEHAYKLRQPADAQLLYNAALANIQGLELTNALNQLHQLFVDFPANIKNSWRAAIVQIYLQLNQPENTLEQLKILTKNTNGDEQRRWREVLVQQYLVLQMSDTALPYVEYLTGVDGLYPRWWKLLTHLHLGANRYAQGLVTLRVVSYLRPLTLEEQRLLADLYLTLGVPQEAVKYYEQLQKQQKGDNYLLTRMTYACLNLHQPQQALGWAQLAQQNPPDLALLKLQGQLLFDLERYDEAYEIFDRLALLSDDAGAMRLMQGYAAWNGKMWDKARLALTRAKKYAQQRQRASELLLQLAELNSAD